jgi:predicted amidohydrolase YtcJ
VLEAHAARTRHLPIVIGSGWQAGLFGDANLTRQVVDAAVADRPCILYDSSYHNACLNSAAVKIAGIVGNTPDPPNGHFVRDATGLATGMLHEDAIPWAVERLPQLPPSVQAEGVRVGQAHANRHGITGIIDPRINDLEAPAYRAVDAEGGLTLRVSGAALVEASDTPRLALERLQALRADNPGPDFWVQSAKFFLDGVFENRTAALISPYADAPGGNADLMFDPHQIAELFTTLDAARFQIHVHVIGDLAARAALDGLQVAMAANGRWPSVHQLAHLQVMDPADVSWIAALGAMANIQPLWARYDPVVPDIALDMIGRDRLAQTYAFRSMLDQGAAYCLSSDWPVSTLNPFEIIETAVTRAARRVEQPKGAFLPLQALTVPECVLGYTAHAAAACWRGGYTGLLLPGFSGDLIVLDQDIYACAADEISETQVLLTLFKGREVYRDIGFGG